MPPLLLAPLLLLFPLAATAAPTFGATFLPANFQALAIDEAGRVAGRGMTPEGELSAFAWNAGNLTFLPAPTPGGGTQVANALEGGVAAGAWILGGGTRGFVYSGGASQDTGTLYGGDTVAWGVNASGQAVGESLDATGNPRAFLYSGGGITDLGTLGGGFSFANAVNEAGLVVGLASLPGFGFSHAFLNALVEGGLDDFTLTEAVGINGAGQIIANGCNEFGFCAPVLLSPVPEPAQALLLLAGLPLLGRRLLNRRHRRAMHRE